MSFVVSQRIRTVSRLRLNYVWRAGLKTTSPSCSETELCPVEHSFYNDEHRALQDSLKKIIDKDINPFVDEWEEKHMFPAHEVFKKLGQAGFLGVNKPTEYGGLGLDYTFNMAVNETLGHIRCGGVPMAIAVQTDMATPSLARFGSDLLKKEFLMPSIAGDKVACVGVSEPGAGSDVAGITTKAVKKGGDLIINGSKMWITNSLQADWMCVLANTGEGPVHRNKSLICVPMKSPGVQLAKKIEKLGMHSSDTGLIYFEDVRVPQTYIIGEEGSGFMYQMLQFQEERLAGAALALKPMQRSIKATVDYCRERKTFGSPVLHHQAIHFRLAELATEVEAYRALLYQTVALYAEGNDMTKWASMCKLKGGRLSRIVADTCLQFWGGMGYTSEVDISRSFRDGRLMSLAGGSDEVMLLIISKYMNMQIFRKEGRRKENQSLKLRPHCRIRHVESVSVSVDHHHSVIPHAELGQDVSVGHQPVLVEETKIECGDVSNEQTDLGSQQLDFISSRQPQREGAIEPGKTQMHDNAQSILRSHQHVQAAGAWHQMIAQYFVIRQPLSLVVYALTLGGHSLHVLQLSLDVADGVAGENVYCHRTTGQQLYRHRLRYLSDGHVQQGVSLEVVIAELSIIQ